MGPESGDLTDNTGLWYKGRVTYCDARVSLESWILFEDIKPGMEPVLCVISILQFYCNLSGWNEPIEIAWEWWEIVSAWPLWSKYSVSAEKSWDYLSICAIFMTESWQFYGALSAEISFIYCPVRYLCRRWAFGAIQGPGQALTNQRPVLWLSVQCPLQTGVLTIIRSKSS